MDMPRNPWIAVLINILLPGLGYIYAGVRMWFGILLIVSEVASIVWRQTEHIGWALSAPLLISWGAFWVATSIDVYFLMRDSRGKTPPSATDK